MQDHSERQLTLDGSHPVVHVQVYIPLEGQVPVIGYLIQATTIDDQLLYSMARTKAKTESTFTLLRELIADLLEAIEGPDGIPEAAELGPSDPEPF